MTKLHDESLLARVHEHALDFLRSLPERHVGGRASRDELLAELNVPLSETGEDAHQVIDSLASTGERGATASAGPRYFGFVIGGSLPVALAADWLTGAWDQNSGIFATSRVVSVAEEIAAQWLLDLFDLPRDSGLGFVTGCQMANFTALAAARHAVLRRAGWNVELDGLIGAPRVNLVVSAESHVTIHTSMRMLGFGMRALQAVDTDEQGRMKPEALRALMENLSGPTILCAQAGNVNTGAVDPLREIAAIAREHDLWFHVDAAYGGGLAFSDTHKSKLRGIELADSVTFDPHKWMFVPFSCGATLVRDGAQILRDSFDMSPEYLSEQRGFPDAQFDFFRYGQMGTRRFNALKLWMCFKFMGKNGYAETTERHIELTQHLAHRLDETPGFQRVGEIETAVCCFRYLPETVRAMAPEDQDQVQQALQQRIERSGKAFFPSTILHGRRALRVNINSYLTEQRHIDDLVELLTREAVLVLEHP